jgi:hypothetical protein
MSLGAHHKNRKTQEKPRSQDEFIDGANTITYAIEAVKKKSSENILLSFSGRIDREHECEKKPVLLYLKKDIASDIDHYCHGNKQGVMNYLLRKGLDDLIKMNKLELVME